MNKLEFATFAPLDYSANEALNILCTNLSFAGNHMKKIMLTSCLAGEGKSFIAMNILRTIAGLGKRVVLVDADLRRSSIWNKFGVRLLEGENTGLAHYLAGLNELERVVYETDIAGAFMVPVGKRVSNSLSLLNTKRLGQLLDRLSEQFDLVIVDTSPIGIIVDAAEVAKSCDGAVFVVSHNKIRRNELREARQMVERASCEVIGAVLNGVTTKSFSSRKYYQSVSYAHEYYGVRGVKMKNAKKTHSESRTI